MNDYIQLSKDSIDVIDGIASGRYVKGEGDLERNIQCLEYILNMNDSGLSDKDKTACHNAIALAKENL